MPGHEVFVPASAGISVFGRGGGQPEVLLTRADAAYRVAKKRGRDAFEFYDQRIAITTAAQQALESDLHRALARRQFVLHHQPQIDTRAGAILGIAALLRWQHPDHGLVSPADFIPAAEQTGRICGIGELALEMACRQMQVWSAAGLDPVSLAVNLSAAQLHQADLVHRVSQILNATAFPARLLKPEVTERYSSTCRATLSGDCIRYGRWGCRSRSMISAPVTRHWHT